MRAHRAISMGRFSRTSGTLATALSVPGVRRAIATPKHPFSPLRYVSKTIEVGKPTSRASCRWLRAEVNCPWMEIKTRLSTFPMPSAFSTSSSGEAVLPCLAKAHRSPKERTRYSSTAIRISASISPMRSTCSITSSEAARGRFSVRDVLPSQDAPSCAIIDELRDPSRPGGSTESSRIRFFRNRHARINSKPVFAGPRVSFLSSLLSVSSLVADATVYIATGSTWKLFRGTQEASNPVGAWREPGFNDGAWLNAAAPIGYGDPPFGTNLEDFSPDMEGNYSSIFLRRTLEISDPSQVVALEVEVNYDDSFVLWINGEELLRINFPGSPGDPIAFDDFGNSNHESGSFENYELLDPESFLVEGTNVVAVMVFNNQINSSDLKFDLELLDPFGPDLSPPTVSRIVPAPSSTVRSLSQIEVLFDESVSGVDADDLEIDGESASSVSGSGAGPYVFSFGAVPPGNVSVRFAPITALRIFPKRSTRSKVFRGVIPSIPMLPMPTW